MSTSQLLVAAADRARLVSLRAAGATTRRLKTVAGAMHVIEMPGQGELPPMVLLHGLSSCGADYAPLFRALRPHTQKLIAVDLPGHGRSDLPIEGAPVSVVLGSVALALDKVLEKPAIVFGNSLGGLAAIRFGLLRPALTAGLFLSSPAGAPGSPRELLDLLETLRVPHHQGARSFVRRVLPAAGWKTDLLAWGVRARMARPEIQQLIRQAPHAMLAAEELSQLRMPITLMWGQRERLLPLSHLRFFRQHLPAHARIELPHGFGHAPFLEDPDAVAERICRFAERAVVERAAATSSTAPQPSSAGDLESVA